MADVVRSRWLAVCVAFYIVIAGVFVVVGLRESSVMAFTGMSRVLFSLTHTLLLLLPLFGLAFTGQVINRARTDGTLELMLSQPIRPARYLAAVTASRGLALCLPLILTLGIVGVAGSLLTGHSVPWSLLLRSIALCTALLWASSALGIAISVHVQSPARAMTYLIVAWALGVALLDFGLIGMLLSWRVEPRVVFALALTNPVESVRIALLTAVEPELSSLGPVGFWVANRLGPGPTLLAGLTWPVVFGAAAFGLALRRFRRGDLV
jgi:ABC-type transport system involved in multi-copper enzyme maturation permease subunit